MTRVFLTGASGFIGAHVARALVDQGCEVHALVRRSSPSLPKGLVLSHGDLTDKEALRAAVAEARPDLCIHLAWYAAPGKYLHAVENLALVEATLDLARCLAEAGCKRLVGIGTCFEYDTSTREPLSETSSTGPGSLYAASKLGLFGILEKFAGLASMTFAWARLFYQYGPGEPEGRLVPHLLGALLGGKTADVTPGEQVRDFLHVHDVASAICAIAKTDLAGAVNVGSGVPLTVRELVTTLARLCGASDKVRWGAIPYRPGDPMFVCADNRKLCTTGWRPRYDLAAGLTETIAEFKRVSR